MVSASDTAASQVLMNFANAKGFTGTNQQKLNQIAQDVARYITDISRGYVADRDALAARNTALADPIHQWG